MPTQSSRKAQRVKKSNVASDSQSRNAGLPRSSRIGDWVERLTPPLACGFTMLAGLLLIAGSVACQIHILSWQQAGSSKQLGYLNEMNWGINFLIALPITAYFVTSAFADMRQSIVSIAMARMVYDSSGTPLSKESLVQDWRDTAAKGWRIAAALGALALAESYVEWWFSCAMPLWHAAPIPQKFGEQPIAGWTVGAILEPHRVNVYANVVFGFLAFTVQGFAGGLFLAFITMNFTFAYWIYRFTTQSTENELLPNVASRDQRRGFEHFEVFIKNLLYASLSFFAVLYLVRLNYLYLQSSASSPGMFISKDILAGFISDAGRLFTDEPSDLFGAGEVWTFSTWMVVLAAMVMVPVAYLVPSAVLGQAAARSAQRLKLVAEARPDHPALKGKPVNEALEGMAHWPLKYPGPMLLLVLAAITLGGFLFYKLTLLVIGAAMCAGLKIVLKAIRSTDNETSADT